MLRQISPSPQKGWLLQNFSNWKESVWIGPKRQSLNSLVLNINRDHCLIAFFSFTKHQYCKLKLALFHLYPDHMRFFVDVNHLRFPIHAITIKRLLCKIETNFAGVVVLQFWMWLLKVQIGSPTLHSGSLPGQRTIRNLQSSSLCFVKSWWESVLLQPWFVLHALNQHLCGQAQVPRWFSNHLLVAGQGGP